MKNIEVTDKDPSSCHPRVSRALFISFLCIIFVLLLFDQIVHKMDGSATVISAQVL